MLSSFAVVTSSILYSVRGRRCLVLVYTDRIVVVVVVCLVYSVVVVGGGEDASREESLLSEARGMPPSSGCSNEDAAPTATRMGGIPRASRGRGGCLRPSRSRCCRRCLVYSVRRVVAVVTSIHRSNYTVYVVGGAARDCVAYTSAHHDARSLGVISETLVPQGKRVEVGSVVEGHVLPVFNGL